MKKKMKIENFNSFFYFERKLLEDYLNDQAKEGYHVKCGYFRHKFEYNPDKCVYYHVDATKTKKRYTGQTTPDRTYIELFESHGYNFVGQWNYFNIFESKNKESIFSDISEEAVVKKMFEREFIEHISLFFMDIIYIVLLIYIILSGGSTDSIIDRLSDSRVIFGLVLILQLIGRILGVYIPLVRYSMTKKIDYTYHRIFKRGYITSTFAWLSLFILACSLLCINVRIMVLTMIVVLGYMVVCLKLLEDNYVKLKQMENILLFMFVGILIVFNNYNNAYVLQHPLIKYKDYSQRSSLMEWSWYTLKDSEDCLYFIDVYEPLLTEYVFNDFIGDNEYVKEGNTYFVRDYVVVRKDNRILKMEKDFYDNHLDSLEW